MTLEYRCSNCGILLQTTNADPLHDEIERLRASLKEISELYSGGRGWRAKEIALKALNQQETKT